MIEIIRIKNKAIIYGLFTMVLCSTFSLSGVFTEATVKPESNFYVTDYAGVINDETREYILEINHELKQMREKPQIAVVVIPTLDGQTVERYALEQFELMKIGNKDYDNGLLVLLAVNDRKIRIEVGYGLEGAINDAKAGRIIDASMSYLKRDDFSGALRQIVKDLNQEVRVEYLDEDLPEESLIAKIITGVKNVLVNVLVSIWLIIVMFFVGGIGFLFMILFTLPIAFVEHARLCKKEGLSIKDAMNTFWDKNSEVGLYNPENSPPKNQRGSSTDDTYLDSGYSFDSWDSGGGGCSGGGGASSDF